MFAKRFVQWLHQRFRYTGIRTLKQNEVLVFIYQQGFLYLVLILITFIAGINYANNLILGFCFLISAILCISFYLSFKQLHGVTIEVIVDEVGKVNEAFKVTVILQQHHASPKFLNFKFLNCVLTVFLSGLIGLNFLMTIIHNNININCKIICSEGIK